MRSALVLGGGMTGLSAGFRLAKAGWKVEVWEAEPTLGGMAKTFAEGDWQLDLGPHKIYSPKPEVMADLFGVLPEDEFLTVEKKSRVRLQGRFVRYPVGLKEMLSLSPLLCFRGGMSYFFAAASAALKPSEERSYEDFLMRRYGRVIYELVFAPYARKIWGPPETLSKQVAGSRVAAPSLLAVLRQALLGQSKDKVLSVENFKYPRTGSGEICEALARGIRDRGGILRTDTRLARVELEKARIGRLFADKGESRSLEAGDVVVSTIPLLALLSAFKPAAPTEMVDAARDLRTRRLILFYLELNKPQLSNDNWIFYPEAKYRWNRAFEQKNFSREMGPAERTCLCLEITCDETDPLWRADTETVYQTILPQLEETGLVKKAEVIRYFERRITDAYPIYDLPFAENRDKILDHLAATENLFAVGRQGSFTYGGMLDCLTMGFRAADEIIGGGSRSDWRRVQQELQKVEVVD